jgi:NitT/TauT family transport system ATP-binding protein
VGEIQIRGLVHEYTNPHTRAVVRALEGVDLTARDGEFVTVVGPSGCGKSTLLYLVAGLLRPSAGQILVDGRPVRGPGADRGMVFQDAAVLPWRTVRQNIGHGLEIQRVPPAQRETVVARFVALCGLSGFEDKYPHELSGGMRQRVAVARTLAVQPKVVLMDEPFAALDAQTRITLAEELLRITDQTRSTVLFVTHSVEEAVFLGDRVVVLSRRPGRVKREFPVPVPRSQRTYEAMVHGAEAEELRRAVFECIRGEVAEGASGTEGAVQPGPQPRGRWWRHRTVLGLLLLLLGAGAFEVASGAAAPAKIHPSLRAALAADPSAALEVRLAVPAEEFHVRALQRFGVLEGVQGDRIWLRDLRPDAVGRLARLYWVRGVAAREKP